MRERKIRVSKSRLCNYSTSAKRRHDFSVDNSSIRNEVFRSPFVDNIAPNTRMASGSLTTRSQWTKTRIKIKFNYASEKRWISIELLFVFDWHARKLTRINGRKKKQIESESFSIASRGKMMTSTTRETNLLDFSFSFFSSQLSLNWSFNEFLRCEMFLFAVFPHVVCSLILMVTELLCSLQSLSMSAYYLLNQLLKLSTPHQTKRTFFFTSMNLLFLLKTGENFFLFFMQKKKNRKKSLPIWNTKQNRLSENSVK